MCLAVPAEIIEIVDPAGCLARVATGEVSRVVNAMCVAPDDGDLESLVGEWVLVHVGFAMSVIDRDEAEATLALLAEMTAFDPDTPQLG